MADYDLGTAQGRIVLKADTDDLDKVDGSLKDVGDDAEAMAKKARGISPAFGILAGAAAGLAATITDKVLDSFTDFITQAVAASDSTDKFKKALEFSGFDNKAIDDITKKTQAYADKTIYSLTDIQGATAQLASNGVPNFEKLVESAGNLNAVAGGSTESFKSVLMMLTQTSSAGKLTTENWNQLADAIPGGAGPLQKALKDAGAYTGNFRDAMSKGEITSKEFNDALLKLGNKPVAVEAATSVDTMEGAVGNLSATITGGLADAITTIKPALTGLITALSDLISGVITSVGDMADYVSQNWTWIGPVAVAIGAAAAAFALWNLAITAWQTATKVATAVQVAFNAVMAANPIMLIVMAVAALVAGLIYFFTQTELGQKIWADFTKFLSDTWTNISKFCTEAWTAISKFFEDTWTNIKKFFTDTWNGIKNFLTPIVTAIASFITTKIDAIKKGWETVWGKVKSFFSTIWEGIKTYIQTVIGIVVGLFTGDFSNVPDVVKKVWEKAKQFTTDLWEKIMTWMGDIPKKIGDIFTHAGKWLYQTGKDIIQGLWDGIKKIWTDLTNWFSTTVGGIAQTVKDILGIHSPSRVMAALGKNTVQGLLNGLDDKGALSAKMASLANGMTASMEGNINADQMLGAMSSGSSSKTNVLNYNAAPSGEQMSQQDLFQAMKRAKVVVPGW